MKPHVLQNYITYTHVVRCSECGLLGVEIVPHPCRSLVRIPRASQLRYSAKYDFYLTNLIGDTLQSEMGKVANSHTFNNVKAGKYNLVVNDPNGCGLLAKPVEVTEPDPVLSFFTTPKNSIDLSVNPELKFSNHSANAQSYLWHFGDGNSSTDENPTHSYTNDGIERVYMVTLTTTNFI